MLLSEGNRLLSSGNIGLYNNAFLNNSDLFRIYKYDSLRNKIYAGNSRPIFQEESPTADNNPFIYRIDPDFSFDVSTDKYTLPNGYSADAFMHGWYVTNDGDFAYTISRVFDFVTGESNPEGFSKKVIKLTIDHDDINNSTITRIDDFEIPNIYYFIFERDNKIFILGGTDSAVDITANLYSLDITTNNFSVFDASFKDGGYSSALQIDDDNYLMFRGIRISGNFQTKLAKYNANTKTFSSSSSIFLSRGCGSIYSTLNEGVYELIYSLVNDQKLYSVLVDENLNFISNRNETDSNSFYNTSYGVGRNEILKINGIYFYGNSGIRTHILQQSNQSKILL